MSPWLPTIAERAPERTAIVTADARTTFAALERATNVVAGALADRGVGAGDRVASLVEDAVGFSLLLHAAQRLGAILAPLGPRLAPDELRASLGDLEPVLLVAEPEHLALARAVAPDPILVPLTVLREETALEPTPRDPSVEIDPEAVLVILSTSGTTGRPKGALLTNRALEAAARVSRLHLGTRADDAWLAVVPLHHVGGLAILARAVIDGATVLAHRRFDAVAVAAALVAGEVTLASLVPTMLRRVLDALGDRPVHPRIRAVLLGGAAVPLGLAERALAAGLPVASTYGLTEATAQVATAPPGTPPTGPNVVGRALPGTEIRIHAPDAEGFGEILVRGPTLFAGYFRRPEATAEALRDGWLHTGDHGRIGADGQLEVGDRRADLVVTGGENVAPAEVERVLLAHPAVADAGVFGLPDEEWGQRLQAAVVLREPTASVDAEALRAWCRKHLAGFKVPREIEIVDDLPRTASGKVQRHRLRELAGAARRGRPEGRAR